MHRRRSPHASAPLLVLVPVIACVGAGPARAQCPAATLPHSAEQVLVHADTIGGWMPLAFDVALWDPAQHPAGSQLTRVELALEATVTADYRVENLSPFNPCTMFWGAHQQVTLQEAPALGVPKLVVDPGVMQSDTLTIFDGALDYAGSSGRSWLGQTDTEASPTIVREAPAVLAAWTGAGTVGLLHTGAGSNLNGGLCPDVSTEHLDRFQARLTVRFFWCEPAGIPYCFGDGGGAPCPCGNAAAAPSGCVNSTGAGATAETAGSLSVALDDLEVHARGMLPGEPALCFAGLNAVAGGAGLPFGDGLRCAGGAVVRLGVADADAAGEAAFGPGLAALAGWSAGDVRYLQVRYRDAAGPCGGGFNLTQGLELALGP